MKRLAGNDWKSYYRSERDLRRSEVLERMDELWDADGDEELSFLLDGALSFPHVYLDLSMDPLIRTVMAVLRSGRRNVVALGPIHAGNGGDRIAREFCLDGFEQLLGMASEHLSLPLPVTDRVLVTRPDGIDLRETERLLGHFERIAGDVSSKLDDGAVLVLTGDLSHYGHAYGTKDPISDPSQLIRGWCEDYLDLIYLRRDYRATIELSRRSLNDQTYPGIVASMALGDGLEHKMFSYGLADYSEVLDAKSPTVVASVFYGVRKKKAGPEH